MSEAGVTKFTGKYRFLSNFEPGDNMIVGPGGLYYRTVEHAYQASKSLDPRDWDMIKNCPSAGLAKHAGRKVKLRAGFDMYRIEIMRGFIRQKFCYNSSDAAALISVVGHIGEGNTWHDTFWGIDLTTGQGFNHLGVMLMEHRDDLTWLTVTRNAIRKDPPKIVQYGALP